MVYYPVNLICQGFGNTGKNVNPTKEGHQNRKTTDGQELTLRQYSSTSRFVSHPGVGTSVLMQALRLPDNVQRVAENQVENKEISTRMRRVAKDGNKRQRLQSLSGNKSIGKLVLPVLLNCGHLLQR